MDLLTSSFVDRRPRITGGGLIGLAAVIALLYYGRLFFITVTIAVIGAFILDPVVSFFMRLRVPRGLASFFTCSLALLAVYFGFLGFYTQAAGMFADLPAYSERINEIVDNAVARIEHTEQSIYSLLVPKRFQGGDRKAQVITSAPAPAQKGATRRRSADPPATPQVQEVRLSQEREPWVNLIYGHLSEFYDILLMASFVPFLIYFMLSWRDHLRRNFLQLFEGADRMVAGKSWEGIADMARAYVVGNFFLGLLLSAASSVVFWLSNLPFPLLVGPISAFLSIIPYVGMPLALAPPFFAALPIYNKVGAYLVIGSAVAFLHLLGLNLLYPKLVGARVHLNPLAVTVSLMFWGSLWGAIGLVLGIPIMAGIKAVCDNVRGLEAWGRLLGD